MKNKLKSFWDSYWVESIIVILGFAFINCFIFTSAFCGEQIDSKNASEFGSFIGGYFGSIFALVSVVLLYATLKNQRLSSEIEKFENKYFEMLRLHRDNVAEIGIGEQNGRKVFVTLIREFRETLKMVKEFCLVQHLQLSQEQEIELAYIIFFYGTGPNSSRVLKCSLECCSFSLSIINNLVTKFDDHSLKERIQKERKFHYLPFEGHQSRLGHYFRHLYQTVTFVDSKKLNINKYEYVKTIRAQLSNHEQALLFFNSLSYLGKPWREINNSGQNLITKYRLISNLPKNFIDSKTEIDVKAIYPGVKFEYE